VQTNDPKFIQQSLFEEHLQPILLPDSSLHVQILPDLQQSVSNIFDEQEDFALHVGIGVVVGA
jgi:hypothetical protein